VTTLAVRDRAMFGALALASPVTYFGVAETHRSTSLAPET
jgi:hypothetical protein